MEEETARKYFITLNALKQQEAQLEQHLEELDGKTQELRNMIDAVEAIQAFEDEEILVPVTNGVFLPAKAGKPDRLLLNVGADTIVERTPSEALSLLQKQQDELVAYRQRLVEQHHLLRKSLDRLETQIQETMQDV